MKQLCLIPKPNLTFGGSLGNTKREVRVLSTKKPLHLILKAQKIINLRKRAHSIESLFKKQAGDFGIKVYSMSVQFDHIHLVLKIPSRQCYIKFIRAVTGLLARKIKKGLWIFRPFTRVANWGREFQILLDYVFQNEMEVTGEWEYRKRARLTPQPVKMRGLAQNFKSIP